jgi:hypothetical protein
MDQPKRSLSPSNAPEQILILRGAFTGGVLAQIQIPLTGRGCRYCQAAAPTQPCSSGTGSAWRRSLVDFRSHKTGTKLAASDIDCGPEASGTVRVPNGGGRHNSASVGESPDDSGGPEPGPPPFGGALTINEGAANNAKFPTQMIDVSVESSDVAVASARYSDDYGRSANFWCQGR